MGLYQCMEHFVEGVKSMTEPNMVIILAWSLGVAMNDIHTSEYISLGESCLQKYRSFNQNAEKYFNFYFIFETLEQLLK